jgi:hypothetical protein
VPARGEVTTISVSRRVAERLRSLREKLGAGSWDELLEKLAEEHEERERSERGFASYEDVKEAISHLYRSARERARGGDTSELERFVVWIERDLSLLIGRLHEEARALLQGYGELAA